MKLMPREKDKLMLFTAFLLAKMRKENNLKLNYPEAVAYISGMIVEGAREGKTVAELMDYGTTLLSADDIRPGIKNLIVNVQVECTCTDGTKLISIHNPIK
ncbi:urease subunit gamma [Photobacterium toruni]|uniref:urease subunit gamma n=1 Tax=Photobacterium toruni TaxID=1935446 RepID=UPI00211065F5|nr:urease subunit gamma [Photobacterium toruni]